ncbi:nuclear transport factor 2 family protein [Streptomyces sp. NBC_01314]|uniref:nuclear transport factor 2 family protein n=1 Tax=Streptomyces sp. NBC_01314 TaxID=2903821 RepID=UPI00308E9394|nr:nuclear transport factor 2 family protein [Streptomyces sp. NBC_01314]
MTHVNDLGEPHAPTPSPDPIDGDLPDPVDGGQDVRDRPNLRRPVDTYASALDRRHTELFASLFYEGGELVLNRPHGTGRPPLVFDGRDGRPSARSVPESYVVTTHFVGDHTVRLSEDSATGETYRLAHVLHPAEGADRLRSRRCTPSGSAAVPSAPAEADLVPASWLAVNPRTGKRLRLLDERQPQPQP